MIRSGKGSSRRFLSAICAAAIALPVFTAAPASAMTVLPADSSEALSLYRSGDPELFRHRTDKKAAKASSIDELKHNAEHSGMTAIPGIDVSRYQGDINWSAVAASGVRRAIIRVGYRGYGQPGTLVVDSKALENLQGASEAGLEVGVYFFTQAVDTREAVEEADFVLSILQGFPLSLPVYYDIENVDGDIGRLDAAGLSSEQLTENCEAFCSAIEAGGYKAGVYANRNWLTNLLYTDRLAQRFDIWLAHYTDQTDFAGPYGAWQFTSTGSVPGIEGGVDLDVFYVSGIDYLADSLTLTKVGETAQPVLSGKSGTVSYRSDNPSVAQVDRNGVITAMGAGEARITAVSGDGSSDSISVMVIIGKDEAAKDEVVAKPSSPSSPKLTRFEEVTFNTIGAQKHIVSDHPFLWFTTDASIARVSEDGVITAMGNGSVDLVAVDAQGNRAVCRVNVNDKALPGDCDDSGDLTTQDASILLNYLSDTVLLASAGQELPATQLFIYDCDADGIVTVADVSLLLESITGGLL